MSESRWASMPTEILIHIFDYLEPVFLLKTVAMVCERFKDIILDSNYCRLSYYQYLRSGFNLIEDVPMLRHLNKRKMSRSDWKDLANHLERVCKRWSEPEEAQNFCSSHGTVIDSVHILRNTSLCAVGTRNKCIDLWNVKGVPAIVSTMANAHNGWVTCLESHESDSFFSGGWDSVVSHWKIREHSFEHLWSSRDRRGVMSIASRPDIVVVASFSPILSLMDPKSLATTRIEIHRKAIVNVKLSGNFVLTVSRDRRLNILDLRILKSIGQFYVTEKYQWPKCLAVEDNVIFIGDTCGRVHLLDMNQNFKKFQKIPVANETSRITSIFPDKATFISGGSDGTFRVIAPSKKHFVIKEVNTCHEITSMAYENGILAIGKTNGYVEIYNNSKKEDTQCNQYLSPELNTIQ